MREIATEYQSITRKFHVPLRPDWSPYTACCSLCMFASHIVAFIWYLLIHLSRYINQVTAKRPLWSSSQAAAWNFLSNHSKVEEIPLGVLPKDTISELAAYLYTIHLRWVKQESCEYQLPTFVTECEDMIETRNVIPSLEFKTCMTIKSKVLTFDIFW